MRSFVIHGHRGSRGTVPENTLASFDEAWRAGAGFIELDVHLSKDRQLVVFHDLEVSSKLCRDASGGGLQRPVPVCELTVAQLKGYECGSVLRPEFPAQRAVPGEGIPTLEEVILWQRESAPGLGLNVEIKSGSAGSEELASSVVGLLRRFGKIEGTLVQSFDFEIVRAVRSLEPGIRLSCLFEQPQDFARIAIESKAQVAAVHFPLLNERNVRECQDQGLEVLPWTVNEPEEWTRLIRLGVASLITDYPARLAEFLKWAALA